MKRDMDLIRAILLATEELEEGTPFLNGAVKEYTARETAFHVQLLMDAGLVEGTVRTDHQNVAISSIVHRPTMQGYDFLDASRNQTIWNKAKEVIMKDGTSWTLSLVKEWMSQQAKQTLGLR
jgi:hypothetical protein